jgi:AP endonuclease-1
VATATKAVRKAKVNKSSEIPEDYPARVANAWKIGAHVSAAGGVENAILNAAKIG